jgi:outer membrane protein assembly factor BamA
MEGVIGDLDQDVPFVDLPRLGGPILLRGYDQDRFRDRVLAMGSAEYQFDIGYMLTGFLFVDAGRVYPKLDELEFKDMRVGYGGGIQLQTPGTFIGRVTVASSIDGGVLLNLSLDPVYDPKARVERK